jgi:hypothetical protein
MEQDRVHSCYPNGKLKKTRKMRLEGVVLHLLCPGSTARHRAKTVPEILSPGGTSTSPLGREMRAILDWGVVTGHTSLLLDLSRNTIGSREATTGTSCIGDLSGLLETAIGDSPAASSRTRRDSSAFCCEITIPPGGTTTPPDGTTLPTPAIAVKNDASAILPTGEGYSLRGSTVIPRPLTLSCIQHLFSSLRIGGITIIHHS